MKNAPADSALRPAEEVRAGDTVYREDNDQTWTGNGPQILASIRNFAMSLIRLKGISAIKETTEWIAGDRARALQFIAT